MYPAIFTFAIDGEVVFSNLDLDSLSNIWQDNEFSVELGTHTFTWTYQKLFSEGSGTEFLEAEIEDIWVTGRHQTDVTRCRPCRLGQTLKGGAAVCEACDRNEYYLLEERDSTNDVIDKGCRPCPEGTYSRPGSVGPDSCRDLRPCDKGHLTVRKGKCIDGERQLTYLWSWQADENDI